MDTWSLPLCDQLDYKLRERQLRYADLITIKWSVCREIHLCIRELLQLCEVQVEVYVDEGKNSGKKN